MPETVLLSSLQLTGAVTYLFLLLVTMMVSPSRWQLMKASHSFSAATYLLPMTVMVLSRG